ncbi:MAG TPA: NAD-dependent succinate-semialdehyde dehydrogenase [bacterium]|nr:NAD-dependent succinate-semialdehyde dehydrogenase [bacterium]
MYRTLNPATEELVREYPEHSWDQARAAAEKAREAFRSWREVPVDQRAAVARRLAALLRSRLARYGALITLEMGKPIAQAEVEIDKCGRGCDYYATSARQALEPQAVQTEAAKSYVRYDPLGVIFGIMPWNFPFWQVFRFAIPALMAGNVVLLKHAPNVPACALEIESLFREAGASEGVFQSLFLTNDDAAKLIESGMVAGVSLTGSDRAGSAVASVAGKNLVKTVLELGGSDPFIVFEDADLDATIPVAVKGRMLNTGQSCIAAKRFLVAEKIYPEFRDRILAAVRALKVGDPTHPETDLGPLAREDLLKNLEKQVGEAKRQGAKVLLEGGRRTEKGFFYAPTVLEEVRPGMSAFDQEVFGPVVSLIRFKTADEAVALANMTSYGLGASLWTRDTAKAEALARRIEAGNVFVNGMVKSDPRLPFGGIKRSGYGRELSVVGIHEFTNIKTVWIG